MFQKKLPKTFKQYRDAFIRGVLFQAGRLIFAKALALIEWLLG